MCKSAVAQLNTLVTTNSSKVLEIMNNVCAGLSSGSAEVPVVFFVTITLWLLDCIIRLLSESILNFITFSVSLLFQHTEVR